MSSYKGESFPVEYLVPDESFRSTLDLEHYITNLQRMVTYFYNEANNYNDTEVNTALGLFFMKAILKRAIRDYRNKLTKTHYNLLQDVINKGEYCLSLRFYITKHMMGDYDFNELEYRVIRVLQDDSAQIYSIGDFNKGRLQKWIHNNISMHAYVEQMDKMTLTREKYTYFIEHMDSFFISIKASDECLSHVVYNPEPVDIAELRQCVPDPFCRKDLLSSPSIAYALSHRLFNILMLRHSRRCYIQTKKEDDDLIDNLCASMYREAVYIARRGFFARDLFLEHVALCSLVGYEEFFRRKWFRKATSWIDDQGCISESHNLLVNRSRLQVENEQDIKKKFRMRKRLRWALLEECHTHPMVLLVTVLAHAVRYTLSLMAG